MGSTCFQKDQQYIHVQLHVMHLYGETEIRAGIKGPHRKHGAAQKLKKRLTLVAEDKVAVHFRVLSATVE